MDALEGCDELLPSDVGGSVNGLTEVCAKGLLDHSNLLRCSIFGARSTRLSNFAGRVIVTFCTAMTASSV